MRLSHIVREVTAFEVASRQARQPCKIAFRVDEDARPHAQRIAPHLDTMGIVGSPISRRCATGAPPGAAIAVTRWLARSAANAGTYSYWPSANGLDGDVAALDISDFGETVAEARIGCRRVWRFRAEIPDDRSPGSALSAGGTADTMPAKAMRFVRFTDNPISVKAVARSLTVPCGS